MKNLFLTFLFTAVGMAGFSQTLQSSDALSTVPFDNSTITSIVTKTVSGNVVVKGDKTQKARVEVFVVSRDKSLSNETLKKLLKEQYNLNITTENNTLKINLERIDPATPKASGVTVSFQVFASTNISTDIQNAGGNIKLTGLNGRQDLLTSGGDLSLEDVHGPIEGVTSGGNITVTNCSDKIHLSTSGGSIVANKCSGNIDLSSAGGAITFSKLDGTIDIGTSHSNIMGDDIKGQLNVSTAGGTINLTRLACAVTAGTSGGDLYADVKEVVGKMRFVVAGGNIDLTLPVSSNASLELAAKQIIADNLKNFTGKQTAEKLSGNFNQGGITVFAQATTGNINLKSF